MAFEPNSIMALYLDLKSQNRSPEINKVRKYAAEEPSFWNIEVGADQGFDLPATGIESEITATS